MGVSKTMPMMDPVSDRAARAEAKQLFKIMMTKPGESVESIRDLIFAGPDSNDAITRYRTKTLRYFEEFVRQGKSLDAIRGPCRSTVNHAAILDFARRGMRVKDIAAAVG